MAIEVLPEPEKIEGKIAVLRANKAENRVYYEYIDEPKNPLDNEVEQLKLKANELETALLEMTTISAEQEQAILELSTLLAGGN